MREYEAVREMGEERVRKGVEMVRRGGERRGGEGGGWREGGKKGNERNEGNGGNEGNEETREARAVGFLTTG